MVNKRKKIGIFDSGIGGFSVLIELLDILPGHEFYYISDKPHSPYGNKSSDFISERCFCLTDELILKNVDLVLVACNTATAEGIEALRSHFSIPFVGIEPFVKAVEGFDLSNEQSKAVVLITPAMNGSARFNSLLKKVDPKRSITSFACPNLASLVEEAYEKGLYEVDLKIETELCSLREGSYSHAILGCTHYPLISEKISSYLGVECISPCLAVAKRVAHILDARPLDSCTELFFKTSDMTNFNSFDPTLLSLK